MFGTPPVGGLLKGRKPPPRKKVNGIRRDGGVLRESTLTPSTGTDTSRLSPLSALPACL